jgi:hypothetical protein
MSKGKGRHPNCGFGCEEKQSAKRKGRKPAAKKAAQALPPELPLTSSNQ